MQEGQKTKDGELFAAAFALGRDWVFGGLEVPKRIPFILGFARSAAIRKRLAGLSGQQRRWLHLGGAIRLGECPWDNRLHLFAIGARSPTDQRGP